MKKHLLSLLILFPSLNIHAQQYNVDSVPVRLKSLEVSTSGSTNKLMWTVACFLQYAKFDIQRSYDAVNYSTINSFQADRLRCLQPFSFEDRNSSGKIYYRVNVGDLDGRVYSSKIITAYRNVTDFDINSLTPTLVTSNATINISSSSTDKAELSIIDIQGKTVFRKSLTLFQGNNELPLNMANLGNNDYFLIVTNSKGAIRSGRFIKQ